MQDFLRALFIVLFKYMRRFGGWLCVLPREARRFAWNCSTPYDPSYEVGNGSSDEFLTGEAIQLLHGASYANLWLGEADNVCRLVQKVPSPPPPWCSNSCIFCHFKASHIFSLQFSIQGIRINANLPAFLCLTHWLLIKRILSFCVPIPESR